MAWAAVWGQEAGAGGTRHEALALTALLANVEVTNFGLPAEIVAVSLTHSLYSAIEIENSTNYT